MSAQWAVTDQLHFERHRFVGGNGTEQSSWTSGKDKMQVIWMHQQKEGEGAEHTVWAAMLGLEPHETEAGPMNPGIVTMLIDLFLKIPKRYS